MGRHRRGPGERATRSGRGCRWTGGARVAPRSARAAELIRSPPLASLRLHQQTEERDRV